MSTTTATPTTITMPSTRRATARAPGPDPTYLLSAATAFGADKVALLRDAFYPTLSLAEIGELLHVAMATGLDPIARQIIGVRKWDRVFKVEVFTVLVKIDGFRSIAERSGKYAGQRGPWFTDGKPVLNADGVPVFDDDGAVRVAWKTVWDSKEPPFAARVDVHRVGFDKPISSPALWSEYADPTSPMWSPDGFPTVMLAKCSEALSLRRAFPNELGGLHIPEELRRGAASGDFVDVSPAPPPPTAPLPTGAVGDDNAVSTSGAPIVDLLAGRGKHAGPSGKKSSALLISFRKALEAVDTIEAVDALANEWAPQWAGADKVRPLADALKLHRAADLGGPPVPAQVLPLIAGLLALKTPSKRKAKAAEEPASGGLGVDPAVEVVEDAGYNRAAAVDESTPFDAPTMSTAR